MFEIYYDEIGTLTEVHIALLKSNDTEAQDYEYISYEYPIELVKSRIKAHRGQLEGYGDDYYNYPEGVECKKSLDCYNECLKIFTSQFNHYLNNL